MREWDETALQIATGLVALAIPCALIGAYAPHRYAGALAAAFLFFALFALRAARPL